MAKKKNAEVTEIKREGIDSPEFFSALDEIAKERGISKDALYSAIEAALISAYRKNYGKTANVRAIIDPSADREDKNGKGKVELYSIRKVVEEVTDPQTEISLEDARAVKDVYELGDLVEVLVTPRNFGRIAAQTGKQVIVQHLREAEQRHVADEYSQKENEILTAIVQKVEENGTVYVELGRAAGVLEPAQQMPTEHLREGDRVKVYVLSVARGSRGTQVFVSRTDKGLVKRLFEIEVPEIVKGEVLVKSIAREAGFRTKMAVYSSNKMIDAVGSCVGPRGMRVENVVEELKTEKIDIVKWSQDPEEYIANALSPARVVSVSANEAEKMARVIVPDNQLSLAIGKEGQNARLAAKLTGWKIDIKSQTQAMEENFIEEEEEAFDLPAEDFTEPDGEEI